MMPIVAIITVFGLLASVPELEALSCHVHSPCPACPDLSHCPAGQVKGTCCNLCCNECGREANQTCNGLFGCNGACGDGMFCLPDPPQREFDEENGISFYYEAPINHRDGHCRRYDHVLTDQEGVIEVRTYPNNADVTYLIKAQPGHRVQLEFTLINLGLVPSTGNCEDTDHLVIRDGDGAIDPVIATFCGRNKLSVLRSFGKSMFIRLKTDGEHKNYEYGFVAEYKTFPESSRFDLPSGLFRKIRPMSILPKE